MYRLTGPDLSAKQKAAQQIKRGNLSLRQAAQQLGMTRPALQRWLKRQGIQTPRSPRKMQLHVASGRAFIEVRRQSEYLGKYGSTTAEKRYHARLSELAREAEDAQIPPVVDVTQAIAADGATVDMSGGLTAAKKRSAHEGGDGETDRTLPPALRGTCRSA